MFIEHLNVTRGARYAVVPLMVAGGDTSMFFLRTKLSQSNKQGYENDLSSQESLI